MVKKKNIWISSDPTSHKYRGVKNHNIVELFSKYENTAISLIKTNRFTGHFNEKKLKNHKYIFCIIIRNLGITCFLYDQNNSSHERKQFIMYTLYIIRMDNRKKRFLTVLFHTERVTDRYVI